MSKLLPSIGMPIIALLAGSATSLLINYFYPLTSLGLFLVFAAVYCILMAIKIHLRQEMFYSKMRSELAGVGTYEQDIRKRIEDVASAVNDSSSLDALEQRVFDCEKRVTQQSSLITSQRSDVEESDNDIQTGTDSQIDENVISLASVAKKRNSAKSEKIRIPTDISKCIDNGQLCMHLQPVLYLLDRSVKDYEALARLDLGQGKIAQAHQFLDRAEKGGSISEIDHRMLFKIVKLIRELQRNDINPNMFWNLSATSLKNKKAFSALENVLRANSTVCNQITAEISQNTYFDLEARNLRKLSTMREMGLKISIDNCEDPDLTRRVINSGLFSDVKIPATTLVGYSSQNAEMMGQEFSELAMDKNVRIIATQVEEEFQVMELIDQDILFGQGNLFSEPKPVKANPTPGKLASIS